MKNFYLRNKVLWFEVFKYIKVYQKRNYEYEISILLF